MRKFNNLITAISFFFVFTLFSCADKQSSIAKEKLQSLILSQSKGIIQLTSFKKTNGQESIVNGVNYYKMDFNGVLEFQNECWKAGNNIEGWFRNFSVMTAQPQAGWNSYLAGDTKHFNRGDIIEMSGIAFLEKSERGWKCTEVQILNATKVSSHQKVKGCEKFIGKWIESQGAEESIEIKQGYANSFVVMIKHVKRGSSTTGIESFDCKGANILELRNMIIQYLSDENAIVYGNHKYVRSHN